MRHKLVRLYNFLDEEKAFNDFMMGEQSYGDNSEELRKLLEVVMLIIDNELTKPQRKCMIEYFLNDKGMPQLAQEMGVHVSVVSRHIKKAKRTILKLLKYSKVVDKYVQAKSEDS